MDTLYTTEAVSTGGGRDGHVQTADGGLALDLTAPRELGGSGTGTNPEQLFAAGYAACFHSAMQGIARARQLDIGDSSVGARVSLGREDDGFGLAVDLEVVIPNLGADRARQLAEAAHQRCPYSRAMRGNIPVTLTVSQD